MRHGIDVVSHSLNSAHFGGAFYSSTVAMMVEDRAIRPNKMPEELAELKRAAIAELERRGYDVRGKTPAQIRQILKRRPLKRESNEKRPSPY
jgi:hypothetical protein